MTQLLVTRLKLAATATAPRCARVFVRATLTSWLLGELAEDAEAIVSELVTNAVRATGTTEPHPSYADLEHLAIVAVQVRATGDSLLIEVWDAGHGGEADQDAGASAGDVAGDEDGLPDVPERGRGLVIVRELSRCHGMRTLATGGKLIWAELDAGARIAAVPQLRPRPLPHNWRQVMFAPSRQPPQHAQADAAFMAVWGVGADVRPALGVRREGSAPGLAADPADRTPPGAR